MNINFHKVFSVDIVDSVLDLVVWFRLVWVDPRLTWKPEEHGGLNKTFDLFSVLLSCDFFSSSLFLSPIKVVLNFVGFSAFWLPPSCGERM
mmetsp:Transcript_11402/g.25034  ORF Transcript_11402/g.25034 Transcript_11402/m.25034 type:complete len:91 (+) Transcript_11402:659-931(+)